ncbi:MAG: SGNH/GDSL hydrolase family protein [Candidatus Rokubacteria bacterium]|nr:SGNH/GDSL hydrolase family protein [Candidatus Rokubacteria bacterium]
MRKSRLNRAFVPLLIGLLPLALVGCGGGGGGRSTTPTPTPQPVDFGGNDPNRLTAIGDSITEGTGERPWPARLEGRLRGRNGQARVNNRGVGGQTTSAGLGTLSHALVADHPGFILILEGTNDIRTGVGAGTAADTLREMVRRAKDNHTVPILATIPPQFGESRGFMDGVNALNPLIRQVAADEQVTLAEVFAALPDESFFSDGLHPNDKGAEAIAGAFDEALAKAGFPTAQVARRRR